MSEAIDQRVKAAIAMSIRSRGVIPTIAEVASDIETSDNDVGASFERLAAAHVFIPQRESREIYAYNPFCVGPTDFHVNAGARTFWGICGWDALGIPAALGVAGEIRTTCPDCREPLAVSVNESGAARSATPVVFRVDVPAREFWADIYFT
jgi:hypothetical protein